MCQVSPSISAAPLASLSLSLLPTDQCVDMGNRVRCDVFPQKRLGSVPSAPRASVEVTDVPTAAVAAPMSHSVAITEKDVPEFVAPIRRAVIARPPS